MILQNGAVGLTFLIWVIAIGLTLWGTFLALRRFRSVPPYLDAPYGLYPVSILKPLKGADAGLRENLETFFNLDYPDCELLFSLEDPRDPARPVVESLMWQYPHVQAKLYIGKFDIGVNPKVNNLVQTYEAAKHDWILISDSNVRVAPNYLRRLVAHLDNGVGVLTAIVAGRNPKGVGGHLEASYLNTFYARGMYMADAAGKPCVIGKSMMFRRSAAKRFGGIKTLACYLAEDYMAGEAMRSLGLRVVIQTDPIDQHIGQYAFKDFWSRHVRWGRIRKVQAPLAFAIEPLFGAMVSGLIGAWALHHGVLGLQIPPAAFLAAHLTLWSFCDMLLIRRLAKRLEPQAPLAWFLRELLAFPLWIHVASGNTVTWRGRKLVLRAGGILETT